MSENLFKKHSIAAMEECVAKALTELLGRPTKVVISGLQLSDERTFTATKSAVFSVRADHDLDWGESGPL